ncbi:hypothetical protein V9T40_001017 [Parthenolecanium corni]|uniref:Protein kinase C-like 3 n=1 Tax=Parthenolecanium corni TaxID=536013 RepID=A0AAN9TAF0_9HEMI
MLAHFPCTSTHRHLHDASSYDNRKLRHIGQKITCDCDATPALQLKAFRQRGDKVEVSHYRVNVNRFRSRLNLSCITEKLHVKVKFDGWPEIKILLAQVGSLKNNNLDEQSLQEVIIDIVTSALRHTNIDFNLNGYTGCPRFVRRPVSPSQHLPLHYDSMLTSSNSNLSRFGEKLIVKVLKGSGLKILDESIAESFCVVEIDNPPQTNQTAIVRGTESPNWNEQFVFNINPRTKEILFEVYSKSKNENEKNEFLGLAIVSVQELLESPSQRQVISLQSRPYQNDRVSGTLTLEFMFLDGTEAFMNGVRKTDEKSYATTPNKGRAVTSKAGYMNPLERDYVVNGVPENATNDIESENRNTSNLAANKNATTVHGTQKDGNTTNVVSAVQNSQNQQSYDQTANQQDIPDSQQNGDADNGNRGRSRRRRDFFGTIRRRLNRSRGRAKSVERNGYNGDVSKTDATTSCNSPSSRSASADRTRDHSAHSVHSTDFFKVGPLPREGSTRSSLSEMSGVSGASSRTYLNEASTLILETTENGIKKYYLVPLSLAQKSKWKKKGTKLHIYNEHTFVAKHLPGGTACQICNRTLPRRLGKQGYECRDCQMKCHKQCHVRTDSNCPSSTVQNLEL